MDEITKDAPKAIPKFTSFRPKAIESLSKGDTEQGRQGRDSRPKLASAVSSGTESRSRNERRHHRHSYRSSPRDSYHGISNVDRELVDGRYSKEQQALLTNSDRDVELCVVDKVGDVDNLKYGSLHRYQIPSYRRSGAGSVIGLHRGHKIDKLLSSEKLLVLHDSCLGHHGKRDKAAFARVMTSKEVRIRPVLQNSESIDQNADFLPLARTLNKKFKVEHDEGGSDASSLSSGEADNDYRSMEGKAKPSDEPEDSDLEFGDDASSDTGFGRHSNHAENIRQITAGLMKRVDLEPTNAEAWLDLITHQDEALQADRQSATRRFTNAERSSLADIKLSMYEKAITKVKDSRFVERLLLGMMDEGAKIWDSAKLSSKWRNVLQKYPQYLELWTRYIDFQQTNFSSFHVDELRDCYTQCIQILREAGSTSTKPIQNQDDMSSIQAYVVLRLTLFLRESGSSELSIAIWQALLEYNYCTPGNLDSCELMAVSGLALQAFEKFWDSEVTRIGEDGSYGWAHFEAGSGEPPDPRIDSSGISNIDDLMLDEWPQYERVRALQARDPARTIDEVEEDDPYRVILFSDVRPFLTYFPAPSCLKILLDAFLAFCHLPPRPSVSQPCRSWWTDSFVRNDSLWEYKGPLEQRCQTGNGDSAAGAPVDRQPETTELRSSAMFDHPSHYFMVSTDLLFANHTSWFAAFENWKQGHKRDEGPIRVQWVRSVLRSLVDGGSGGDELDEYLLAFECNVLPNFAKKTAKALLKRQPANLRLYNAFALIQYRTANSDAAQSVVVTAINMSRTLDKVYQCDAIFLWRTWIWELIDCAKSDEARGRLLTVFDTEISPTSVSIMLEDVPPAAVLRTQRVLIDGQHQMLAINSYQYAYLYSECLALLAYLTDKSPLDAAVSAFASQIELFSSQFPPASPALELLHQARARLLHYHTVHTHSFKPAVVRSVLADSITAFPQNTIFLSLYAWNERRSRIDDRVRSILQSVTLRTTHDQHGYRRESVISHFFAVYTELNHSIEAGSNIHSVRSTFERAVDSEGGKSSAALWKLYFLFEHSRGDFQRAKGVFYRSTRACPWAKALYLLPFQYLSTTIPAEELKGVYDTMVEKGIRVHVSLDDTFENIMI